MGITLSAPSAVVQDVRFYAERHSTSLNAIIYDALMIAAANKAGCPTIFTEDLNNGQKYGNVTAVNPFG